MKTQPQQSPMRFYVHPESEALSHGMGVWQPGEEVPAKEMKSLPDDVIINWKRNDLIITEDLFQQYFAAAWNARHSRRRKIPVPIDPDRIELGDTVNENTGPDQTRTIT
jgi:hypothetical protein